MNNLKEILDEITPDEFKDDENIEYSYIVSVRPNSTEIGTKKLEYGLDMFYEIGSAELKKLEFFNQLINDKLFEITHEQARKISNCNEIPPLSAMRARVRANPGTTLHLFKTRFKATREDFEIMLQACEYCESSKQMWLKSKI